MLDKDKMIEEVAKAFSGAPFPSDRTIKRAEKAIKAMCSGLPPLKLAYASSCGLPPQTHIIPTAVKDYEGAFDLYNQLLSWGKDE